jgi:glycosyltransferase involved in cell wall biosynthesis
MIIGIASPIEIEPFREYLDEPSRKRSIYVKGIGGTSVNILACRLLERGQKIILFSVDPRITEEVVLEGPRLKICIGPMRQRFRYRVLDFHHDEREYIHKAIEREKPDIVHANWTYECALGALAADVPCIVTVRDALLNVLKIDVGPARLVSAAMALWTIFKARRLVAVSPYIQHHLRKFFRKKNVPVIPNGYPEKLFEMGRNRNPNNSPKKIVFATVLSEWSPLKNGKTAILAFSELKKKYQNCVLLMFGSGYGAGEKAQHWAREQGLHEGISFVGRLSHGHLMERLSKEVDVLVHPSLEESFSCAGEAMALRILVIGGEDSGGVPWVLENGKAGLLVNVKSPKAIAETMKKLVNNPEMRNKLSEAGWESAKHRFHIDMVADAYMRIYEETLNG